MLGTLSTSAGTSAIDKPEVIAIAIIAIQATAGWVTSVGLRQATHRPTGLQLGRVRLSQSCHRQHLLSQRCLKRKPKPAKHGPFQRIGLNGSQLARLLWAEEDIRSQSQQILGNFGVHLQAFAGWTSSFSSRLCRATALETFQKKSMQSMRSI